MGSRIGVDVGGTFTDLVMLNDDGLLSVAKVPSTPSDPADGVMFAIDRLAEHLSITKQRLLEDCELFVHGSTIATNTMLEGKGAKTGMVTTDGFKDSLEIRRGARVDSWDHRSPFAPVLVPRYLRVGLPGRVDRDGVSIESIDMQSLENAARLFQGEGVESIAICLINSFVSDVQETQVSERLGKLLPSVWITQSSDIAPIMGEYERGSTTVVNAYLLPKVVPYLRRLDKSLSANGLKHPLLLVQSNGGAGSVAQVERRPARLLLSGPAAAVGSLDLVSKLVGTKNLISMEIGGTSCDVVMMNEGEIAVAEDSLIAGYHVGLPSIDVHTVGAGGGTIASVDSGGMLRVGPNGAGAYPGPSCYSLGGTEPTVTDALVVLGRLSPGRYAGGSVALDKSLAESAVRETVGSPLGISTDEAAIGLVSILEQNLLHAVERISIERGHDPSQCTLVAAGGAGPMHGCSVARALGCRQVYVPRQAGAYCALGMLNADVRRDEMKVLIGDLDTIDEAVVLAQFDQLVELAERSIFEEGFTDQNSTMEKTLGLHYAGQQSYIRVSGHDFDRQRIRAEFESVHQRMFGHIQPDGPLEIGALHATGVGELPRLEPVVDNRPTNRELSPIANRRVFCDLKYGTLVTPLYRGDDLYPGFEATGPLLIEEQTTTIYVGKDDQLTVDTYGNYLIILGGKNDGS